jgi:hypothetical protein
MNAELWTPDISKLSKLIMCEVALRQAHRTCVEALGGAEGEYSVLAIMADNVSVKIMEEMRNASQSR